MHACIAYLHMYTYVYRMSTLEPVAVYMYLSKLFFLAVQRPGALLRSYLEEALCKSP